MDSKEKIITAAIDVFAEKGKHGARMEEIAARAKVNKAMLYYFYTTKENLFRETLSFILMELSKRITSGIQSVYDRTSDQVEILRAIVRSHFDAYSSNMQYTKIMLDAVVTAPEDLRKALENLKSGCWAKNSDEVPKPDKMIDFLKEGIAGGAFRKIDPKQVMISIIGMNMVYFSSKPISQVLLDIDVDDENKFLKERQESIIDLLLYGIMEKRSA